MSARGDSVPQNPDALDLHLHGIPRLHRRCLARRAGKDEVAWKQRDGLAEMNRALRLEEASLRDPERIDTLARKLGLQSPQAGQVMHMDTVTPDAATPELASVNLSSAGLRPAR